MTTLDAKKLWFLLSCAGCSYNSLPSARTQNCCFSSDKTKQKKKSRVFGEAGSDVEFWGGGHVEIREKNGRSPFFHREFLRVVLLRTKHHDTRCQKALVSFNFRRLFLQFSSQCQNPEPLFFENQAKKETYFFVTLLAGGTTGLLYI